MSQVHPVARTTPRTRAEMRATQHSLETPARMPSWPGRTEFICREVASYFKRRRLIANQVISPKSLHTEIDKGLVAYLKAAE